MSDREALAAALDAFYATGEPLPEPEVYVKAYRTMAIAARERLAQLPEKCGECKGTGKVKRWRLDSGLPRGGVSGHQGREWPEPCPTCHGSGKVYPVELVERIGETIRTYKWSGDENEYSLLALAVLDALNGETP